MISKFVRSVCCDAPITAVKDARLMIQCNFCIDCCKRVAIVTAEELGDTFDQSFFINVDLPELESVWW